MNEGHETPATEEEQEPFWFIDLKIALVRASNWAWNLRDIDEMYIESLLPFMARLGRLPEGGSRQAPGLTPVDQAAGWM